MNGKRKRDIKLRAEEKTETLLKVCLDTDKIFFSTGFQWKLDF